MPPPAAAPGLQGAPVSIPSAVWSECWLLTSGSAPAWDPKQAQSPARRWESRLWNLPQCLCWSLFSKLLPLPHSLPSLLSFCSCFNFIFSFDISRGVLYVTFYVNHNKMYCLILNYMIHECYACSQCCVAIYRHRRAQYFVFPNGNQAVTVPAPPAPGAPDLLSVSVPSPVLGVSYKWNLTIHTFLCLPTYFCFYLKEHFCYLKGKSQRH